MKKDIVIATIKSWNIKNTKLLDAKFQDKVTIHLINSKDKLTTDFLKKINPQYIFFPHWSWIIPEDIYSTFECVVFHMTDLPYGRGGSPLQNLINNKVYKTKVSAIKVVKDLDAGDVYMKIPLDIEHGNANQILKNVSDIIFSKMIPKFINETLIPNPQQGEIVAFERRIPSQSNLLSNDFHSTKDVYDFIRMLNGEGYPHAYVDLGNLRINFSNATLDNGKLTGTWEIENNE